MRIIFLILINLFIVNTSFCLAQQKNKIPEAAPVAKFIQEFALSEIEITYSRPSINDREIFGGSVPFGMPWITGGTSPVRIKFNEELEVKGVRFKPGEYAVYTIPGKEKWEVIFNLGITPFTVNGFDKGNDVARFYVEPTRIPNMCQTFTVDISDILYNTCKLNLVWEKTKIAIPITAHDEVRINKNIENILNQKISNYFEVAQYIFESGGDLDKANFCIEKALEKNENSSKAWYLKACIDKKSGKLKSAIKSAQKSLEKARGCANESELIYKNRILLDELNKR